MKKQGLCCGFKPPILANEFISSLMKWIKMRMYHFNIKKQNCCSQLKQRYKTKEKIRSDQNSDLIIHISKIPHIINLIAQVL